MSNAGRMIGVLATSYGRWTRPLRIRFPVISSLLAIRPIEKFSHVPPQAFFCVTAHAQHNTWPLRDLLTLFGINPTWIDWASLVELRSQSPEGLILPADSDFVVPSKAEEACASQAASFTTETVRHLSQSILVSLRSRPHLIRSHDEAWWNFQAAAQWMRPLGKTSWWKLRNTSNRKWLDERRVRRGKSLILNNADSVTMNLRLP